MRRLSLLVSIIYLSTLCVAALPCYGLGDGSSLTPDMPEASGIINLQAERERSAIATFGFEHIFKRKLEDKNVSIDGEMEADWTLFGLGWRINNRFEPYVRLGAASMTATWVENNNNIEMQGDYSFGVAAGLKALLYKARLTSLSRLKIGLDTQMRYSQPSVKTVIIETASRTVSAAEFRIIGTRTAAIAAVELSLKDLLKNLAEEGEGADIYLVPYIGAVYTNSLMIAKFYYEGVSYGYLDTSAEKNISFLGGMDIVAPKYLLLNIEGQFFGEESVSGGVNIKF